MVFNHWLPAVHDIVCMAFGPIPAVMIRKVFGHAMAAIVFIVVAIAVVLGLPITVTVADPARPVMVPAIVFSRVVAIVVFVRDSFVALLQAALILLSVLI